MRDENVIEDILADGGLLARHFGSYEERPDQIEMSKLVMRAFDEDSAEVIEAGTGIGKSFAYLAPAILHYQETGEKTVIATSTITLQKQLVDKDIPTLLAALKSDVRYALLMGRSNYLCLRRYYDNSVSQSLFRSLPDSEEGRLAEWVRTTEEGVLDELSSLPRDVSRSDIACDYELCSGPKCPYNGKCFFFSSRRKAENAGLIVTNHHLLFMDARKRFENDEDYSEKALLPPYGRLIIDECHNSDRNATSLFTTEFSYSAFFWEYRKLLQVKHGVTGSTLIALAAARGNEDEVLPLTRELEEAEKMIHELNRQLVTSLRGSEQRVDKGNYALFMGKYSTPLLAIKTSLDDIARRLDRLIKGVAFSDDEIYVQQGITSSINAFSSLSEVIKDFTSVREWKDRVYYLSRERNRVREDVKLCIAPIEISGLLRESLFSKLPTIVCLSATLKVDSEFDFFRRQVGLDEREVLSACYESPFDYRRNLLLLIDQGSVLYRNDQEEAYFEYASERIIRAVSASGGGALVLFTSYKMLSYASERAKERLKDFDILVQDGTLSRSQLLRRFKEERDSVLFATQSFWEGVDIPGDSLRLVILTKLPYPQVNEPLFKSRCEKLDSEGKNSFMMLSVPSMLMKLKQGLGRLIRSKDDKGVAYILDGRMNRSRDYFLSQLPECNCPEDFTDEALERRIEDFLY